MNRETALAAVGLGVGLGVVANILWRSWSGHTAFQVNGSPLSFIEHHHIGTALIMTGNPVAVGLGIEQIIEEALQPQPFGAGKTQEEVTGNVVLTSGLLGMAATDIDGIRDRFRKETAKLDRWIYQKDIREYFKEEEKKGEKKEEKK